MADLNRFKERVREYRLLAGRTQSELSLYLNLDYTELSNRLNGKKRTRLNHENVRTIVRALAEWGGIASQAQARELLDLMDCPYFEPVDWSARPLNRLKVETSPSPAAPAPAKIFAPPPPAASHLPLPLSSFVGRDRELAQLTALLQQAEVRLLTLTGAGGIGKTRLALQVAGNLKGDFEDGLHFIDLAPVSGPQLVPVALAQLFNLQEVGRQNLDQALAAYLADKNCLLIFDNFEHVLAAAGLLKPLLAAAPRLKILVTSREALHLYGEHEFEVFPLSMPDLAANPPLERLAESEAVNLFVERARAVKPGFELSGESARVVAEICVRLAGWPLAIELAATYVKLLSPQALLRHLQGEYGETSLQLLKSASKDRPDRHQTIRRVLDWSYNLLTEPEKHLFDRLGVFAGNYSFEVALAVCGSGNVVELLEGLGSLLDKSLLYRINPASDEPRYYMLEPVQRYAQEQLIKRGEDGEMRRRHCDYYLGLAEQAELALRGPEQVAWLQRLKQEHFNLQAAFNWALNQPDPGPVYRLAGALGGFWESSGFLTEGRRMLEAALKLPPGEADAVLRAKTLGWLATLAFRQGDYAAAVTYAGEGLSLFRASEDTWGDAWVLRLSGTLSRHQGRYEQARALFEESLQKFKSLHDRWGEAWALSGLGSVAHDLGELAACRELHEKSLAIFRQIGDKRNVAYLLNSLGELARRTGDYATAGQLYAESLELNREIDYRAAIVITLHNLGYIDLHQQHLEKATQIFRQCLELNREMGRKRGVAACLVGLAGVAAAQKQPERAARLLGAAEAIRESINSHLDGADLAEHEAIVSETAHQLDPAAFRLAWEQGRRLDLAAALRLALD